MTLLTELLLMLWKVDRRCVHKLTDRAIVRAPVCACLCFWLWCMIIRVFVESYTDCIVESCTDSSSSEAAWLLKR